MKMTNFTDPSYGRVHKGGTMRRISRKQIAVLVAASACVIIIAGCMLYHWAKAQTAEALAMAQTVDKAEVKEMKNDNIAEKTSVQLRDHWTVAAFGLDSREPENLKSGNSDVIILMDMDGKTGSVKLVSVYRDTCMDIGKGTLRKANAAYANGGPKQAVRMLNDNLDMEIDDYIAVTWKSVADAVNVLGGVDLEVTKNEFRYINAFITETVKSTGIGSHQLKALGMQHLDGVQAVAYCRLRLMDSDFKRTERQQKVLRLALEKAKKADMTTLNNLMVTILPQTATSIETDDLFAVMKNILKLHITETHGFPSEYVCEKSGGADYVFPNDLERNVKELHEFLYNTEDYNPSGYVLRTSEAIEEKKNRSKRKKTQPEEERWTEQAQDQPETTQAETESNIPEMETEPEFWDLATEPFLETIPETEQKEPNGYGPGFEAVPETNEVTTESQAEIQSQPEPELQTEASTCWRRGLEK